MKKLKLLKGLCIGLAISILPMGNIAYAKEMNNNEIIKGVKEVRTYTDEEIKDAFDEFSIKTVGDQTYRWVFASKLSFPTAKKVKDDISGYEISVYSDGVNLTDARRASVAEDMPNNKDGLMFDLVYFAMWPSEIDAVTLIDPDTGESEGAIVLDPNSKFEFFVITNDGRKIRVMSTIL